jgi:uncharacterized protein YndB with AHSA1/START domain
MRNVQTTIIIDASPDKVLAAFTTPSHLHQWWNVERSLIDLKEGGLYSLVWEISGNGMRYVTTGIIKEYLPACQLRISNLVYFNPDRPILGPLELLILTTPEDDKTTLTVIQSGYQKGADWEWYYNAVNVAWPEVLKQLKSYLEKRSIVMR